MNDTLFLKPKKEILRPMPKDREAERIKLLLMEGFVIQVKGLIAGLEEALDNNENLHGKT